MYNDDNMSKSAEEKLYINECLKKLGVRDALENIIIIKRTRGGIVIRSGRLKAAISLPNRKVKR